MGVVEKARICSLMMQILQCSTPCVGMNQDFEASPPILERKPVVMVWSPVMMETPTRELRCALEVV